MTYLLPFLLGLAHGVSDASAGLLVGTIIQQGLPDTNTLILLYNLLAFGLQPLVALLFDYTHQPRRGTSVALLLTTVGLLLLQTNLLIAIVLIGLGSAGLHAGAGSVVISTTPGKASAPGVFAAFGVVGLAVGGLASFNFASTAIILIIILLICLSISIWFSKQISKPDIQLTQISIPAPLLFIILLLLAVALRSTVWVGTQTQIERYSMAALWLAMAAGLGKLIGGFAADLLGWTRWVIIAMTGASVLLIFYNHWFPALLLGALLLQSLTPLSIAAFGRALPQAPALAASLALGTAIIAGGLPFFLLNPGWYTQTFSFATILLSMGIYGYVLKNLATKGSAS